MPDAPRWIGVADALGVLAAVGLTAGLLAPATVRALLSFASARARMDLVREFGDYDSMAPVSPAAAGAGR